MCSQSLLPAETQLGAHPKWLNRQSKIMPFLTQHLPSLPLTSRPLGDSPCSSVWTSPLLSSQGVQRASGPQGAARASGDRLTMCVPSQQQVSHTAVLNPALVGAVTPQTLAKTAHRDCVCSFRGAGRYTFTSQRLASTIFPRDKRDDLDEMQWRTVGKVDAWKVGETVVVRPIGLPDSSRQDTSLREESRKMVHPLKPTLPSVSWDCFREHQVLLTPHLVAKRSQAKCCSEFGSHLESVYLVQKL